MRIIKTIVFSIIAILFFTSTVQAAIDLSKEPDEFRGIKWGTERNKIYNLFFASEGEDGTKYYVRKNENNKIGTVILDGILYGFRNDIFCEVYLQAHRETADKLLQTLKEAYGPPSFENVNRTYWNFSNVSILNFRGRNVYVVMGLK